MTIFVAGAAGAVGRPLCRMLVLAGYRVAGTTRSADKAAWLASIGVEPVIVDVFNAAALSDAVASVRPEVVMHQLTDLPRIYDAATFGDALVKNARIRDEGTRHLVAAAVAHGARRIVAQSIAFSVSGALLAFEQQILDAPLEGVVLRYGQFYGPGTWTATPPVEGPVLHVDAAAAAAVEAVDRLAPGRYEVTDGRGVVAC